jgi:peptide/nickel transport system substrate-binding protein
MTDPRPGAPARRWRGIAALVMTAALVAAGCGGDDSEPAAGTTTSAGSSTTGPGATASPASSGGEGCTAQTPKSDLTMGVFTEATSLDPTVSRGAGVTGGTEMASIYDTLMRWNPDTGAYEPRIAESVEPNADFTQWTLKLRPGVTFGNGDPFTSAAVKASIERFQVPTSTSRWAGLSRNVASMDTPDDLTVVFHLTDPWATFPYLMAHEVGMIVNPKVVDQLGADAFGKLPKGAGAGAFDVDSFTPGEGITMHGRSDYWGGPVCIGTLRFVYVAGAQATYDAFKTGQFQVAFLRDPKVIADAKHDGVGFFETKQNGGGVLMINSGTTPDHPTTDLSVRQAIAHAIDPTVLNTRVYDGDGLATDALFGPESRLHTIDGPGYDLDQAKQLVAEAKAAGFDGELHMLGTSDPTGQETAIALQAMLQAAGFTVRLDSNFNTVQMITEVNKGNYDIVGWGLNIDDSSPWMKLDSFLNSTAPGNVWGLKDPGMDAAIKATKVAAGVDELKAATQQVQEVWNAIVPGAIFSTAQETVIWDPSVHGIVPTQESNVFLAGAWVD